jgi:hypothetical protein
MIRCTHEGPVTLFPESVEKVTECLKETNVQPVLITMIEEYLLAHGSQTMESCITAGRQYILLAQTQDLLGWDCFMEGQIPSILIKTIKPQLHQCSPRKSIDKWGIKFIKSLINITHKQWIYRNADVHHVIDGLTSSQHTALFAWVQELLMTDINYLLPCHRHLLSQDFHQLDNADTLPCQLWVTSMESAMSAASHVASGHFT